jgi:5-methylcytosine-specific restriction endonuclease McrA
MLMDQKAVRERIDTLYRAMKSRAKPKFWKSGKKAGRVRGHGLDSLPFTRDQFWLHALAQVGEGCIRCPYCIAIGRPANLIDLVNCVFDHKVPVARGGTHTLDNIVAICADCNNCKGKLSYEFFLIVMQAAEQWHDPADRSNFHSCLRTHGVSQRLRGFVSKGPGQPPPPSPQPQPSLALQEDF